MKAAKSTLKGIDTIRMIVTSGVDDRPPSLRGEIVLIENLFAAKAWTNDTGSGHCTPDC